MAHVNWHPYPGKEPPKPGNYWVTYQDLNGGRFVSCLYYLGGRLACHLTLPEYSIVAWAEFCETPEPYQPEF